MKRTRSALLAIVAIETIGRVYQASGECATAAATEVEAMIDELTTMTSQFHTVGSHIKAPACTLGDHR